MGVASYARHRSNNWKYEYRFVLYTPAMHDRTMPEARLACAHAPCACSLAHAYIIAACFNVPEPEKLCAFMTVNKMLLPRVTGSNVVTIYCRLMI